MICYIIILVSFCIFIFILVNVSNNNYKRYLECVINGERIWTVDVYNNRSILTGEKLGHNNAINGDSIYYGLDSHEVIINETEYNILHERLKAIKNGKTYFYFSNNINYYKIDVSTGERYVLLTKIGKKMRQNKHIENPNDFYNVEYWHNPIIKNNKYKLSQILGVKSNYEI